MCQCQERGITPGPINTFPGWKSLGRWVRKGQKAITLCQPVTVRRRDTPEPSDNTRADRSQATASGPSQTPASGAPQIPASKADDGHQTATKSPQDHNPEIITRFVYKPRWFVLAQTEGEPLPEPAIPSWDASRALSGLDVTEVPFDHVDGNCLGFARERSIAINPVNPMPHKTRFHELGHVLLGHTSEGQQADSETTPRSLRECEAETVALLCCAALDLPGVAECRGYIQSWWGQGHEIPERSAQRILKVADQILKAGTDQGVRS